MRLRAAHGRFLQYPGAVLSVVAIAVGFHLARAFVDDTLVALLLLLPVGILTALWGLGPGITSALTAFLAFNYFFITPYFTFTVHRAADLVVLVVFLIVAVVMSQLLARAQASATAATAREREATELFELSTALAGPRDLRTIAATLAEQVRSSLECESALVTLSGAEGEAITAPAAGAPPRREADLTAPIQGMRGALGEIRLWRSPARFAAEEVRLAKTFASQGAMALERASMAQADDRARLLEESDRFKSTLLSSVSHDLRTPLATIKAAASSLRTREVPWESSARAELVAVIDDETDHLNMLVGNLLEMSRLESNALRPQRGWNVLREIVQSVAERMRRMAEGHELILDVPEELPLVPVDFVLMVQVFTNLMSNSLKFAPAGTPVRVRARVEDDERVLVEVSNQGPPVPEEHLGSIFDKFYRMTAADRVSGTGLGLSICRGILEAHGGSIWAENLPDGFAFRFTLPLRMQGEAPQSLPQETE